MMAELQNKLVEIQDPNPKKKYDNNSTIEPQSKTASPIRSLKQ